MSFYHHLPARLDMNPHFLFISFLIDLDLIGGSVNNLLPVLLRHRRAPDLWLHYSKKRTLPVSYLPHLTTKMDKWLRSISAEMKRQLASDYKQDFLQSFSLGVPSELAPKR